MAVQPLEVCEELLRFAALRHVSPTTTRRASTPNPRPSSTTVSKHSPLLSRLLAPGSSPLRGLLKLYSCYGLRGCSPTLQWALSRGFDPAGYPTGPLVSYHVYRQLHRWGLPSLVICAVEAHTEMMVNCLRCWKKVTPKHASLLRCSSHHAGRQDIDKTPCARLDECVGTRTTEDRRRV